VFDDLKIRSKLVLLVAGPLVIVVVLAALGASSRLDRASQARGVEGLVSVARSDSDVVNTLQQESLASTSYVGSGGQKGKAALTKARANTDNVLAASLPRLKNGGGSSAFRSAKGLAVDAADKLTYIRKAVDQGYGWDQVVTTYATLGQTFLAVNTAVVDTLSDPAASSQLRTAAALADYKAAISAEGSLLSGASQAGGFSAGGDANSNAAARFELFKQASSREQSRAAVFASIADSGAKGAVRDALATPSSLSFAATRDATLSGGATSGLPASGATATADTGALLESMHGVETQQFTTLLANTAKTRTSAERSAKVFLGAALLAIIGAALAAVVLGRKITRPLVRLTAAAGYLATEQMPRLVESLKNPTEDEMGFQVGNLKPIDIGSNDEIGQLASAFNEVQRVAGDVAAEQASLLRKGIGEMFVNLARRNQALLDRQIEFIDELERGEEDPDQLDNLYRLDHLATRMRRNAESLLVLAGAEPPRRRGRPAALVNVVRAALAEVEDFGRIELLSFDEVLVASNAAADVAHLLSELMENATNFSPPETRVEVVGHRTKADGYVISVTDHGIGMSSDQITDANESLAKPPPVGLALSRSLGFIVVGRLAARHGISVRIMPSAAGGVTSVVSLASALIVDTPGGVAAAPMHAPARLKPVLERSAGTHTEERDHAAATLRSVEPFEATVASLEPTPVSSDVAPVAWAPPASTSPMAPAPEASGPTPSALPGRNGASGLPTRSRTDAASDMPEALPFSAGPSDLPSAEPAARTDAGAFAARQQPARPFFLDDAEPVRGFPETLPTGAPAAPGGAEPAKAAPRLFGGPEPTPRPAAKAPLPGRCEPTPTVVMEPGPEPKPVEGAPAEPVPVAAAAPPQDEQVAPEPPPAAVSSLPTRTGAGLAKRTPRAAGGRAIPGAEVERNVGATRRSPEEIRAMLASHSAGRQRAQSEPVPAGAPDERQF
jgi:signal transduction histidine kinase